MSTSLESSPPPFLEQAFVDRWRELLAAPSEAPLMQLDSLIPQPATFIPSDTIMKSPIILSVAFALAFSLSLTSLMAQGTVYLVLGSDTAIWDGMDVAKYYCTYNLSLFDDPTMNAKKVMDPSFRNQFKDSYGQSMKMTWWMMAGDIFRYATNTNVPVPNIMTLYLMKKYHGENVKLLGDELSLHYHTFVWTDYNNDGKYFWNQAKNFTECKDDFNVTLAQFLLEENTFPVSFRSGWHYMDNEWQNYLDKFVPYSLHNDYPNVRASIVEPIDNVFDWSRASKEFVPFHPSLTNYQLPGNANGWNTRSIYMASISQAQMDDIFLKAKNGVDQVPCFWAHLPEADFPQNMKRIDSLVHISAAKYPAVNFRYCTAVEAMQRWRKGADTTAPVLTLGEIVSGDNVTFSIQSNEKTFQAEPFVAMKNVYEDYSVLRCVTSGINQWTTADPIPRSSIAKVGVALTDTMGNQSTKFLNYYPDDIFIDNLNAGYSETRGTWTTNPVRSWGTDSRQSVLSAGDSAIVNWSPSISQSVLYNIFMQVPKITNAATELTFKIFHGNRLADSVRLVGPFMDNEWVHVITTQLRGDSANTVRMIAYGNGQSGKIVSADVIKLSALVMDRSIFVREKSLQLGPVSEGDTLRYSFSIGNHGVKDLTISEVRWKAPSLSIGATVPLVIPGMSGKALTLSFYSSKSGLVSDTLVLKSDDPRTPLLAIPLTVDVQPYFATVDNEDSTHYFEKGAWAKSVAQAWGASSRYAPSGTGASAAFTTKLKKSGLYEVFEIVPTTVNSVTNALYLVRVGGDTIGSVVIDQNKGSGNWVSLGKFSFPANVQVEVKVIDNAPPVSSVVVRADAIKFQIVDPTFVEERSPSKVVTEFELSQNYPNPFNPSTVISYQLPVTGHVMLTVFDILGREVCTIVNERQDAGRYSVMFDAARLSSGVYFYQLQSGSYSVIKKMLVMK